MPIARVVVLWGVCSLPPLLWSCGPPPQTVTTVQAETSAVVADLSPLGSGAGEAAWLGAAAGLAIPPRRGLERDDITPTGLDGDGWFHAPDEQTTAPWYVIRLLADLDLAERILQRGTVIEAKSIESDHIIFKARIALHPDDAVVLGEESIRVAIKPAAAGVYGSEYRRELAFYKLGRYLQVRGLVPMVERDVAWAPLREAVDQQLVDKQRERLHVRVDGEGQPQIHGSVQLWVEGYMPFLGSKVSSNKALLRLAKNLRPKGEPPVFHDPLWQGISDMLVLDFLVSNSDRSQEAGSVRLRDGGQRLVMLDNGDTLLFPPPDGQPELCVTRFEALALFSPNVIEGLSKLDRDGLDALLRDNAGEPLVKAVYLGRVLKRIRRVEARVRQLEAKKERRGSPLFSSASRDR